MKVSAPEYVDFLMTWIQKQLDDEKIFPSQVGKSTSFFLRSYVNY